MHAAYCNEQYKKNHSEVASMNACFVRMGTSRSGRACPLTATASWRTPVRPCRSASDVLRYERVHGDARRERPPREYESWRLALTR